METSGTLETWSFLLMGRKTPDLPKFCCWPVLLGLWRSVLLGFFEEMARKRHVAILECHKSVQKFNRRRVTLGMCRRCATALRIGTVFYWLWEFKQLLKHNLELKAKAYLYSLVWLEVFQTVCLSPTDCLLVTIFISNVVGFKLVLIFVAFSCVLFFTQPSAAFGGRGLLYYLPYFLSISRWYVGLWRVQSFDIHLKISFRNGLMNFPFLMNFLE